MEVEKVKTGKILSVQPDVIPQGQPIDIYVTFVATNTDFSALPWVTQVWAKMDGLDDIDEQFHPFSDIAVLTCLLHPRLLWQLLVSPRTAAQDEPGVPTCHVYSLSMLS